ncbi:MAG: thioredoxin family protein [Leptospirales bacterium]
MQKKSQIVLMSTVAITIVAVVATLWAKPVIKVDENFNNDEFLQAQNESKTILVSVHADWCPTCKKQSQIIKQLTGDSAYKDVVFLRVNFDNDDKALLKFAVAHQSTLIVFSGKQEIGRSTGETSPDKIRALLDQGT